MTSPSRELSELWQTAEANVSSLKGLVEQARPLWVALCLHSVQTKREVHTAQVVGSNDLASTLRATAAASKRLKSLQTTCAAARAKSLEIEQSTGPKSDVAEQSSRPKSDVVDLS